MQNRPTSIVSVGIQARSTSSRFPRKMHAYIHRSTVLDHVLDSVNEAACYINRWGKKGILVDVTLLVPEGDEIIRRVRNVAIIEGSEDDVLSRYAALQKSRNADYVVRITGDCPLIPSFIISKLINIAALNAYDYVSNVDERCRTTPDGFDCEVISKKLLCWADETAREPGDREHVTTLMRRDPPKWCRSGTVVNFLDLSHLKLSADTEDDLKRIREEHAKVERAFNVAVQAFGRSRVHRL